MIIEPASVFTTFAGLRSMTTSIVEGTAVATREGVLAKGTFPEDVPVTLTTFGVTRTIWGARQGHRVTIEQLGGKEFRVNDGLKYLMPGKTYLLFIRPSDLHTKSGYFNIASDGAYVRSEADFQSIGQGLDKLPAVMPANTAASLVTAGVKGK